MTLRLNSTGGGYIEIDAPNTASNFSVTMPAAAGDVVVADASGDIETTRTGTGASSGSALVVGYQQGIWTPEIAEVANIANKATDYSNQIGRWWRIGNMVSASCTFNMNSAAGLTSTSAPLCVLGYPYKQNDDAPVYGSSSSVHANGWTQNTVVSVNVLMRNDDSRTNPIYYATSTKAGNYGEVNYNIIGTGSLIYTITYLTDNTDWAPINGATVS
jgi:hypothetical protein